VLACYFLGPLFTDWAPGCFVRCGCIGSPVSSFPVDGGGVCPLVLCSLLLLSVLDRLRLVQFCKYEMASFMFCLDSLIVVACVSV